MYASKTFDLFNTRIRAYNDAIKAKNENTEQVVEDEKHLDEQLVA